MSDTTDNLVAPTVNVLIGQERVPYPMDMLVAEYGAATAGKMVFEAAQHQARSNVDEQFDLIMRKQTGNASVEERDTWKTKEEASRAILDDSATPAQAQMIALEAQFRGVEPAALAQNVVAKSDGFKILIGMAAGIKAKAHAAIDAATSEAELIAAGDAARADIAGALAQLNG